MANILLRTRNVGQVHASFSVASGKAKQIFRSLSSTRSPMAFSVQFLVQPGKSSRARMKSEVFTRTRIWSAARERRSGSEAERRSRAALQILRGQFLAQILQGAKLQLLDGSLTA